MADSTGTCILLFDSIHHVLAAEQAFLQRGIWHDVVPTPRDVHTDCGMVIQFRHSDRNDVAELLSALARKPKRTYRFTPSGYEPIDLATMPGN